MSDLTQEREFFSRFGLRLPCPKCKENMTAEDYVASKYPDGYRRVHHGYFPEGEDYKTRYPEDGTTLSNTLFFRCSKCNTNVKWSLTSCIHTLEIKRRS